MAAVEAGGDAQKRSPYKIIKPVCAMSLKLAAAVVDTVGDALNI